MVSGRTPIYRSQLQGNKVNRCPAGHPAVKWPLPVHISASLRCTRLRRNRCPADISGLSRPSLYLTPSSLSLLVPLTISLRPPLYLTHPYFILYFIYLLSIFHPISFHPISFPIPLHVSSACRFCGSFCFPLRLCPLSYSTFVMVSPSRLMRPSSARWRISLTMEVRLAVMFARMSRMVVPCGCDAR